LTAITSRDSLLELYRKTWPDSSEKRLLNQASQVWRFKDSIALDDLVMLPLKTRPQVAVGRVKGPYAYRPDLADRDACHTRSVEWIKEIPRGAFAQDLLYTLGAFMTVFQVSRNNAEERIRAMLSGTTPSTPAFEIEDTGETGAEAPFDLEAFSTDIIQQRVIQRFKGHGMANLVAALLRADGYVTEVSPPGADGGIDILAGRGPLGFDAPRIGVQVKSTDGAADVSVLRELQGVLKGFGADHGLLVCWGGFKQSVIKEAKTLHFEIRLWDATDIVSELTAHYDALPADIQAELPLKRVWTLLPEAET
jgi:restriction system protein